MICHITENLSNQADLTVHNQYPLVSSANNFYPSQFDMQSANIFSAQNVTIWLGFLLPQFCAIQQLTNDNNFEINSMVRLEPTGHLDIGQAPHLVINSKRGIFQHHQLGVGDFNDRYNICIANIRISLFYQFLEILIIQYTNMVCYCSI